MSSRAPCWLSGLRSECPSRTLQYGRRLRGYHGNHPPIGGLKKCGRRRSPERRDRHPILVMLSSKPDLLELKRYAHGGRNPNLHTEAADANIGVVAVLLL